eukprot:30919-Pelagococcus_subviridis.AAC.7
MTRVDKTSTLERENERHDADARAHKINRGRLRLSSQRRPPRRALSLSLPLSTRARCLTVESESIPELDPRLDLTPPDQPPVLLHPPRQRHLLALLRAHRRRELQLREIALHRDDARARAHRPDVQHEHLRLGELRNLPLLLAPLRPHAEQPPKEEEVHLQLREHLRELPDLAEDLPDEAIRARQRGVHRRADADEASGHGVPQLVLLREQRDDPRRDAPALDLPLRVLGHDPRADFDLLANLEDALEDRPARDAALHVVHLRARLVHVERPDHDHVRRGREVALRHRDLLADVLAHDVDVVLELRGDGDDGRAVRDGALDEFTDGVVLVRRRVLLHQVDLVLKDDDVLQPHDLHRGEVLRRLRLRARLVPRDEQQRAVHHRGAVEHRRHEDIVPRAVHEGDVPHELHLLVLETGDQTVGRVRARAAVRAVARGARAEVVLALVDLGVSVP